MVLAAAQQRMWALEKLRTLLTNSFGNDISLQLLANNVMEGSSDSDMQKTLTSVSCFIVLFKQTMYISISAIICVTVVHMKNDICSNSPGMIQPCPPWSKGYLRLYCASMSMRIPLSGVANTLCTVLSSRSVQLCIVAPC